MCRDAHRDALQKALEQAPENVINDAS
ncbi:uncharacterized protein G2W53_022177 [Senna tora]|uniref:Uncharacterized protein n=1 Tax=Senna tora TaxID=362788 RepID=A0A834TKT1_9FABA|nr:uncharacterized protein G2W53_022177 [Senna tora]